MLKPLKETFVLCSRYPMPATSNVNWLRHSEFKLDGVNLTTLADQLLQKLMNDGFLRSFEMQGIKYFQKA
jgi:hypothetical protein